VSGQKRARVVFKKAADSTFCDVCLEIRKRYEVHFCEISIDKDHLHFLVQSIPKLSVSRIITIIESIIAVEKKSCRWTSMGN